MNEPLRFTIQMDLIQAKGGFRGWLEPAGAEGGTGGGEAGLGAAAAEEAVVVGAEAEGEGVVNALVGAGEDVEGYGFFHDGEESGGFGDVKVEGEEAFGRSAVGADYGGYHGKTEHVESPLYKDIKCGTMVVGEEFGAIRVKDVPQGGPCKHYLCDGIDGEGIGNHSSVLVLREL